MRRATWLDFVEEPFDQVACAMQILAKADRIFGFSTTLAESNCAIGFQGFVFGSMDTIETVAEG